MIIPIDVEADAISVLPPDIGALLQKASRRADDKTLPGPKSGPAPPGWPDLDPARAWLSCEATCLCLGRMLLQWRFGHRATGQGPYEQASADIDAAVRALVSARDDELQLRVLDGIVPLKAVARQQVVQPEVGRRPGARTDLDPGLTERSQVWIRSARGYVRDGRDLRNAVVYTAVVLRLELAPVAIEGGGSVTSAEQAATDANAALSDVWPDRERLALAAAGGCHVAAYQHDWLRRAVRDNVAWA